MKNLNFFVSLGIAEIFGFSELLGHLFWPRSAVAEIFLDFLSSCLF